MILVWKNLVLDLATSHGSNRCTSKARAPYLLPRFSPSPLFSHPNLLHCQGSESSFWPGFTPGAKHHSFVSMPSGIQRRRAAVRQASLAWHQEASTWSFVASLRSVGPGSHLFPLLQVQCPVHGSESMVARSSQIPSPIFFSNPPNLPNLRLMRHCKARNIGGKFLEFGGA